MKKEIASIVFVLLVSILASCTAESVDGAADTTSGKYPDIPEITSGAVVTTAPAVTTEPVVELIDPVYDPPEEMCLRYIDGYNEYFPVKTANDSRCFYLPSGADLSRLPLYVNLPKNCMATLDGKMLDPGYSYFDLSEKGSLDVRFKKRDGAGFVMHYTFVKSTANVLSIRINEELGSVAAMNSDSAHETVCYGEMTLKGEGAFSSFDSFMSMKGRGNATWTDEKKGYVITFFKDGDYTEKKDADICGMGSADKWILTANHRDRTLLRNALAFTLAQRIGMRSAIEYVFTDLYINGEYKGLYLLSEKIDRERVGIKLAKEDNIDGGYLLEFDNYSDSLQVKLKTSKQRVTINSPENLSSYKAIEEFLNRAEAAIDNSRGLDPSTGKHWYDFIDIESFAQMWIVREYSLDYDTNVNYHLWFDPADQKLYAGPAWDFDNSFARTTGIYANPETALVESGERNPNCWLTKLMKFDEFRDKIISIYNAHSELFNTDSENSIYALALKLREQLEVPIEMNFTVWNRQLTFNSWNMPKDKSYEGHFGILTDFIERRNLFWQTYIPQLADR